MTSQILMSNHSFDLPSHRAAVRDFEEVSNIATLTNPSSTSSPSSDTICLPNPLKSPYQADQQEKLQHLQAEAEALLQQVQQLKQQRLTTNSH